MTLLMKMEDQIQQLTKKNKRGYAIVSQIFALLHDLPIGNLRIEIGLALRQAWLINGILFNSEIWYSVTEQQIAHLVDKYLLRGIVGAHALAALPIKYVLSARRMILLQTILK